MAGATYNSLATTTLSSNATSITFSSISSAFTDLVLVLQLQGLDAGGNALVLQFNGDTATNYSNTSLYGTGTAAASNRYSGLNSTVIAGTVSGPGTAAGQTIIVNLQNYSNTSIYKTVLSRYSNASKQVEAEAGLWRSTSAINSIKFQSYTGADQFLTGTTATLYGIAAA
jgi:hypothetical protein